MTHQRTEVLDDQVRAAVRAVEQHPSQIVRRLARREHLRDQVQDALLGEGRHLEVADPRQRQQLDELVGGGLATTARQHHDTRHRLAALDQEAQEAQRDLVRPVEIVEDHEDPPSLAVGPQGGDQGFVETAPLTFRRQIRGRRGTLGQARQQRGLVPSQGGAVLQQQPAALGLVARRAVVGNRPEQRP